MIPPLVEAHDLARRFTAGTGQVTAVLPASFTIAPGDKIALSGPSGSGKSTLLNLMAGIDEPSAGAIDWPGIGPRNALRPLAVGMIHQFAALVPTLSVAENVALPLRLGHVRAVDEAVREATALMQLSDFADRLPGELSGGQAQRAGIARVLAHRPTLLLADEPTGQLDHAMGQAVLTAILDCVNATGAAIVVATHDAAVARRLEKTWRMDHGLFALPPEGGDIRNVARAP
jgi:ABC-type lipoprotein export system ATPase subunit